MLILAGLKSLKFILASERPQGLLAGQRECQSVRWVISDLWSKNKLVRGESEENFSHLKVFALLRRPPSKESENAKSIREKGRNPKFSALISEMESRRTLGHTANHVEFVEEIERFKEISRTIPAAFDVLLRPDSRASLHLLALIIVCIADRIGTLFFPFHASGSLRSGSSHLPRQPKSQIWRASMLLVEAANEVITLDCVSLCNGSRDS